LPIDTLSERLMRGSNAIIVLIALLAGCATYYGTSTPTVARWEGQGRDISELIKTIGPYDTTEVKGDWRSYDWFRFGNCHLTAHTSLEGKIDKVELQGVGTGCNVYLEKLGGA
jgi:hypothetical protein